ncbi:hypothetical protein SynBIOSU31_01816 [Synechococcus sp. BIOS-U3-1]|uniref:DUF4278 domain-containing protein n=1 Tax=Synechococcus sp. BIOS-U3-1 TaxID=1400865 RepID=UPI001648F3E9|nr:DUF4278 domain-containing protein [Synechococcus sp. BIOS-U3-1]QNI58685.1 hypothetical protein SynBIOSU31_01816 [Synechococcus sp. BIOS-U3-1]
MTALTYRGQAYTPQHSAVQKQSVELTYRREHYNTRRQQAARELHPQLVYRGVSYTR